MINENQRKIIVLILLIFSFSMIINSANAATIDLNPGNFNKTGIESATNGTVFNLDTNKGDYNLSSENKIDIKSNITIKSSNTSKNAVLNLYNSSRAFQVHSEGYLTLINITIKNGYDWGDGGAIHNTEGSINLTGCIFSGNSANRGGAISIIGGGLTANFCIFTGNSANHGGAIFNVNSNVTLTGCSFSLNSANSGGTIYNDWDGILNANGCSFSANKASGDGGAIFNWIGNVSLSGCSFSLNNASYGGAITNGGILTVTTCSFSANKAINGGGAIYKDNGNLTVTGCSFSSNNAGSGGAISNTFGDFTVTGCSFSANKATEDSNTIFNNGNCIVSYSRFVDNVGNYQIYNDNLGFGSVVANYNWWGSNANPQGKYSSGVTVSNYFVMSISTSVANLARSFSENLAINYKFVLNGTNDNANATTKFSLFTVAIMVNGKVVSNIDGRKSVQYNVPLTAIDNTITATLNSASSSFKYKASKMSTKVVVNKFHPLFKKSTTVTATVTDKNGKVVVNKQISLYINGKFVKTVKTNVNGVATFKYTFKTRKTHKIQVKVIEDTTHVKSNSKTLSLIPKDKTTITLAKFTPKYNKKATLKATLKNNKNKAMAKKVVKFYANGKLLGQAKTNAKGVATLTKKISVKGSVNFIAKYAGDKTNHDSDYTRTITVK